MAHDFISKLQGILFIFFGGKRYSFSRCFALEIATTLLSHSDMKSGDYSIARY